MTTRIPALLRIAFAAIAVALVSLGLACGGDDDESIDDPTATESAANSTDARDDGGDSGDDSGDDTSASPELEAYFAEIEAIFEDADAASDELDLAFDEAIDAATNIEEEVFTLQEFLLESRKNIESALDDLEDVEPTEETEDAHNDFVQAGRDLVEVSKQFSEGLQDVETEADLDALNEELGSGGQDAADAADTACFDLQDIADAAGISVDLNCEE
jgi:hypothetical protein